MKDLKADKEKLRKEIAFLKSQYSLDDLLEKSDEVMSVLEITGVFQAAKNIFIYNAMADEVATASFVKKWEKKKKFFIPVTLKDEIVFRKYSSTSKLIISSFGIEEPTGEDFTNYDMIDLIIVPGVAFDRKMGRMGRGKGYYDKFLPQIKAPKAGICFDFQLLDAIPINEYDIKMDYIISENDLIW